MGLGITVKNIKSALGFGDDDNVGVFYCCSTQSARSFATSFSRLLGTDREKVKNMSCLIACAYDIDGYFSKVRAQARKIGYNKPAFLYSSLLPTLQGSHVKMSASIYSSAIFFTDDEAMVREKLERAFSTKQGGTMDTETVFQYLRFFMQSDEEFEELEESSHRAGRRKRDCEEGEKEIEEDELTKALTRAVQEQVAKFQKSRGEVTDDYLKGLMTRRLLE